MVDADDIGHPREAFDIGLEVGEDRTRRPNPNDPARAGNHSRMIGRDLPALRSGRARHRSVRQHQRLGRDISGPLDELVGPMRGIDDDSEPVTGADHLGAEVGQSAMHRGFGLDVAEIVDGGTSTGRRTPSDPPPVEPATRYVTKREWIYYNNN